MKQILTHLILGTMFSAILYLGANWSFIGSAGSGIVLAVVLTVVNLLIETEPPAQDRMP